MKDIVKTVRFSEDMYKMIDAIRNELEPFPSDRMSDSDIIRYAIQKLYYDYLNLG